MKKKLKYIDKLNSLKSFDSFINYNAKNKFKTIVCCHK